jgi:hypothetical protein
MTNNNLADLSAFESLQSDQHGKTGMSSMSVFNAMTTSDMSKYTKELDDVTKKALEARRTAGRMYQKVEALVKKLTKEEFDLIQKEHLPLASELRKAMTSAERVAYAGFNVD